MDATAMEYASKLSSFLGDLERLNRGLWLNSMQRELSEWRIRKNITNEEDDEKKLQKLSSEESDLKSDIEKAMKDKDSLKSEALKYYNGHMPTVLAERWAELESNYSDYINEKREYYKKKISDMGQDEPLRNDDSKKQIYDYCKGIFGESYSLLEICIQEEEKAKQRLEKKGF